MNEKERNQKYCEYVEAKIPKTKPFPTLFNSFWVGGVICIIGQLINELYLYLMPNLSEPNVWTLTLVTLIFIASVLTAFGIYDKIGAFAGAGSIVPITGFSNSVTSPALEFNREGIIFGICVKMFTIAGPVIVSGIVASFIVGVIYSFI